MPIKKRNILCLKDKESLKLGHLLLYNPYKNILQNFLELATKKEAKDFDPVARVYHGLLSAPTEVKDYYEALLGVTSYYQASKGGRGRYIEKKLASNFSFSTLDVKLSQIPFWLTYPDIHKKKGLFTLQSLSSKERQIMHLFNWDWIGNSDEETDLGSFIKDEGTIVLMEIKNRVDSGGTAARREIWTSQKFGIILSYLEENKKIYKLHEKGKTRELSLDEMLAYFGIKKLELYIGILFDIVNSPASIESDRKHGFYSSSKEGFKYVFEKIKESKNLKLIDKDSNRLFIKAIHSPSGLVVECGALYGNDISKKLFRKAINVSDLLLLKYDDIWLSQLLSISERANLLKYGKNYITIFFDILKRDIKLRQYYDRFINSQEMEEDLKKLVDYLINNYSDAFLEDMCESDDREGYIADILQFIGGAYA